MMGNWEKIKLESCIKIISGYPFDSSRFTNEDGMPLLRIRDLRGFTTEVNYDGPYSKNYIINKGDTLIGMDGDFHTVLWKGNNVLLNQRVCKIEIKNQEVLDRLFLFYRLISEIKKINEKVSATTVKHLSTKDIYSLVLSVPSLAEQARIAAILSTADEAIANTEALIAKYQSIKTGLMQDLLTCGIDEKGNILSKRTHKFVKKNGIEVPVEWDVVRLKEICSIIKDGTHLPPKRVESGIWLLGVTNIIDGEWKLTPSDTQISESFYHQMHKNWKIEISDVLLAIVGATVGKVTQVPDNFPIFTIQRSICLLRGKDTELSNNFLRLVIESPFLQRVLWNEVNVTAQPGLYLGTIGKIFFRKPSIKEQLRIYEKIKSIKTNIDDLKTNLAKLQSIKTGLMQDLLSGKK